MKCTSYCKLMMLAAMMIGTVTTTHAQTEPTLNEPETKQTLEVNGYVTGKKGEPLMGVVVQVKGTNRRAVTNEQGAYTLSALQAGDLTLTFHYIGCKPEERHFVLSQNQRQDAQLSEATEMLQGVEVVGRNERSYKNTRTFVGTKTATAVKDVPQSIGYVTKELVLDQGATTVNDVVKNISGVNQYTFYNDFSIRGFRTTGNRNSGNLINGMRAQTSLWKQQSLANIERVEVIKGPASALFGNAAPGGVINRVTKKPLAETRRQVSTTVGSYATFNAYADFTGKLNPKGSLLYRLNLGYENTDSYRDLQGGQNFIVAPSFSYVPNHRTQFNVDVFYQQYTGKIDRGQSIFGDGDLYSVPISRSLSAANDYLKERLMNITLGLTHKFTDRISFNSTYLNSSYDEDMQEHNQANAYVLNADSSQNNSRILMQAMIRKRHFRNNSFNNYLNVGFNTGRVQHTLLVGWDYFQTDLLPGTSALTARGYLLKNGKTTTKFNKSKINNYVLDADGNPKTNVPYFDLNNTTGNSIKDISKYVFTADEISPYRQYSHGIYLQEQLRYGPLQLLLGLRQEYFTDILNKQRNNETRTTQHALIPRVGAVLTLNKQINLYGTWVKGFEPQSASVQSNPNTGAPFSPEQSQLFEVGAKSDWFDHRLSITTALFHLTKNNTLYNAGDAGNPDLLMQVGEEVSKGVEVDVAGELLPNWSVVVNYAYTDAKITKTASGTEKDLGMQRPNTPRHAANIWTKYILRHGPLRNLGIGLGVNANSERFGQVGKRANTIVYPGYALLNAALYYRVRSLQLQLNADNLLNKTYWVGGYDKLRSFPGSPFFVKATATYRF